LSVDYMKGAQALTSGDYTKAAELLIPLKMVSDGIGAFRKATEGKTSKRGMQTMTPYSLPEAVVRTFGFTPAREAETNDAQSSYFSKTQRLTRSRSDLQQSWLKATPSERLRLWGQVEGWNKGRAPEERLTRADLDSYVRRRRNDERAGRITNGLRVTSRTRNIMDESRGTYNF